MQTEVSQAASFYKAWGWFETNKKQVAWGVAIALVVGLLAWFFLWRQSEREVTAGEALSAVSTPELGNAGARADTANAYLKIAANYPNSAAGTRALLLAAGSLFVDGKFPEAQAQFERFIRDHRDSPLVPQAQLGVAASLEAQGKTAEATTAYKNLVDHHPTGNIVSQARFALGRLYEAQNKFDLALAQFSEAA